MVGLLKRAGQGVRGGAEHGWPHMRTGGEGGWRMVKVGLMRVSVNEAVNKDANVVWKPKTGALNGSLERVVQR